ncbi:MAG: FAD:protein FMN transferase [Burkholderiaceae bacterium]|nr:FAD:protein FMN transferase [Burkholderiaceae bacterium]
MTHHAYADPSAASYHLAAPLRVVPVVHELGGPTMGTRWSVKFWHPIGTPSPSHAVLREGIDAALATVVRQMSPWEPDSDISRFNRAGAGEWQTLPEPFFTVLHSALAMARDSGDAYDPTVGPVVDLWGFGPAPARGTVPAAAELQAAHARVGWQRIVLDVPQRRVRQPGGSRLDLSSIAKGHAVDAVARVLRERGCVNALVEVGGELLGCGRRPDGEPWRVAVKLPGSALADGDAPGPVLSLPDLAVATSGDDFRHFVADGERCSHTIDPRTGRPIRHALASVTVVHAQCMQADALATALLVQGPEAGWAHAERLRLAALFIRRSADGHEARPTAAFEALLA